jgi:phosphatidylinositol alpha-1,6-mannosyltransferase
MHGIEAWGTRSSLQRLAVEAADLVLCVSRHTRSSVLNWASIAPERVVVLPNTVCENFKPDNAISSRTAWGLSGKRVLLTVGRMDSRERYKGHDRVIAAIPQLIAEGHDVVYLILGEGDDRARLEAIARKADIIDRVRFMGLVSQEVLLEAYRIADLFVMPSTGEGFGIAFLEAMASGTPAVGLAVAGAVDAFADGELGIAVRESELPAALCHALLGPKPRPEALAASVHARFGRECFASRAHAVLKLCMIKPGSILNSPEKDCASAPYFSRGAEEGSIDLPQLRPVDS